MSERKNIILVPCDFTKVSDIALEHALTVASHKGSEINLLNVVSNKDDVKEAHQKLDYKLERARAINADITVKKIVRVGSIYDDIGEAAAETQANMIIMGTHGMRGLQFITGSRVLRVIMSSDVPFIIVQERTIKPSGYDSIVVPLDLHKETRQKLTLVADMALTFKSKVHLITPMEKDEFLHKQLLNNIKFATQYLDERKIAHDTTIADSGQDFVKEVIRHANAVNADLISIMNLTEGNIFGRLGVPYEQEIMTNEGQIPVIIMKPRETGVNAGWTMQ